MAINKQQRDDTLTHRRQATGVVVTYRETLNVISTKIKRLQNWPTDCLASWSHTH